MFFYSISVPSSRAVSLRDGFGVVPFTALAAACLVPVRVSLRLCRF